MFILGQLPLRIDSIAYSNILSEWDTCAAHAIVLEAGGSVNILMESETGELKVNLVYIESVNGD